MLFVVGHDDLVPHSSKLDNVSDVNLEPVVGCCFIIFVSDDVPQTKPQLVPWIRLFLLVVVHRVIMINPVLIIFE